MNGEFISIETAKILFDKEVEKIQEKNKMILDMWDKEGLAQGWVDAHLRYKELQQRIDKAIEFMKEKEIIFSCMYGKGDWHRTLNNQVIDILEGKDE